jgi:hypothetical protein
VAISQSEKAKLKWRLRLCEQFQRPPAALSPAVVVLTGLQKSAMSGSAAPWLGEIV